MMWLYGNSENYGVLAVTGIIIFIIIVGLFMCNKCGPVIQCNNNSPKEQIVNDTIKEQVIQYDTILKNDSILILKVIK